MRDWLACGALAALSGVCVVSIRDAAMRPPRLVDRLDHAQLLDWLGTRDVAGEFSAAQLRLARRVAEDFRQGYDWRRDVEQLDEPRRDRCLANFRALVRRWLLDRADRYAALAEPERTAYIDEQLDDLLYWPIWQRRSAGDLGPAGGLAGLLPDNPLLAAQQIDAWTDGLEAAERERVRQFAGAVYLRWLQRGLQFLPGGRA